MTKYVVCDYWESGALRLFSQRSYDLGEAMHEVTRRQTLWAAAPSQSSVPSEVQVFELKGAYPASPPADESNPSYPAKFPNR